MNLFDIFESYQIGSSISSLLEKEELNIISMFTLVDDLEKNNQRRFWVRDNSGIYQHPELLLDLDEPLQVSKGPIQEYSVRNKLYAILFDDYLRYNEHGLINYSIFKDNTDTEVWIYVSVSDEPIQEIPYGSYGPLPKGTQYKSYQSGQEITYYTAKM